MRGEGIARYLMGIATVLLTPIVAARSLVEMSVRVDCVF